MCTDKSVKPLGAIEIEGVCTPLLTIFYELHQENDWSFMKVSIIVQTQESETAAVAGRAQNYQGGMSAKLAE